MKQGRRTAAGIKTTGLHLQAKPVVELKDSTLEEGAAGRKGSSSSAGTESNA